METMRDGYGVVEGTAGEDASEEYRVKLYRIRLYREPRPSGDRQVPADNDPNGPESFRLRRRQRRWW